MRTRGEGGRGEGGREEEGGGGGHHARTAQCMTLAIRFCDLC